jgi:IMP dehydrogenase
MLETALSYSDVMLLPKHSEIESRAKVDLSVEVGKGFKFASPLVPSNMKTITGEQMALYLYSQRQLGLLHRFMNREEKFSLLKSLQAKHPHIFDCVGMSIGIQDQDYKELDEFVELGVRIICVDVAHLDCRSGLKMVSYIAKKHPQLLLIAGNTATRDAAYRAYEAGVDGLRQNIGSGAICTTRIETGNGVPAFTSVKWAAEARDAYQTATGRKVFLIADGGASSPGDVCKALCFADMVMCGSIFAGTNEANGESYYDGGRRYKHYDGSSTYKPNRIEGVRSLVEYKGDVSGVFQRYHEGLQSCCSYQNAHNLSELKRDPQFVMITNAGWIESNAHGVKVIA